MSNNNDNFSKEKPPLQTITGKTCLTECYSKDREYLNPITIIEKIRPQNTKGKSTCGIVPIRSENPNKWDIWGVCRLEDNQTHRVPSEKASMLLNFYFDANDFLVEIYDLHTFNQVITWTIENSNYYFATIKRVHNCAWKVFGSNIENISEIVIDFYYELAKNNWLKDYIVILKSKYSFDMISENNPSQTKISSLIIKKFFDKIFFIQIIKKYIETYSNVWNSIGSHYGNLKKFTFKCLVENIKYKNDILEPDPGKNVEL
jgi:hypothetical protein